MSASQFERQVAQALADIVVTRKPVGKTRLGAMLGDQLAPYIAAAIEAAAPEVGNDVLSYQDICYEAALKALRGEL